MDRPLSDTTSNMLSHPWGDFARLAQAVIHDAEIQVNPLLPGAMPGSQKAPGGISRNTVTVICLRWEPGSRSWPVCILCKWRFIREEGPTFAEQTRTALGRKPAEKQPAGSGQVKKYLPQKQHAEAENGDKAWPRFLRLDKYMGGSRVGADGSTFVSFLSTLLLPGGIRETFQMYRVVQGYGGSSFTESKALLSGVKRRMMGRKRGRKEGKI